MQITVRQCAKCAGSNDPLAIQKVRKTEAGFETVLVGGTDEDMTLCEDCVQDCARAFDELGKTEWERGSGAGKHCAICSPSRCPPLEDLSDFRRAQLATLRTNKEVYATTTRRGVDGQQKVLGQKSASSGKTRGNLKSGCAQGEGDAGT